MRSIVSPLDGFASPFGPQRGFNPLRLFANDEPGVWFEANDANTLFTDVAGTTPVTTPGDAVALQLDKSQGAGYSGGSFTGLGPELVTNGGFDTDTDWTLGTGWTISGGTLNLDTSISGVGVVTSAQQSMSTVVGKTYRVTFDVTSVTNWSGNEWFVFLGSINLTGGSAPTVGPYDFTVVAQDADAVFLTRTSGQVDGDEAISIDNISVKELPGNHRTQATTAARPLYALHPVGGVRNLFTYTEEFDNAAWVLSPNGTGTITKSTTNAAAAPNGTITADRVLFSLNGGTSTSDLALIRQANSQGGTVTHSIWVRSFDGVSTYVMQIILPDGNGQNITITGEWQRFSVSAVSASSVNYGIRLRGGQSPENSDSADVLIWGAQLEEGSTATNYQRVGSFLDVSEEGKARRGRLWYNGTSHFMETGTITPGTDKAQVFAGVRTLNDGSQPILIESSESIATNNGCFHIKQSSGVQFFRSKGTLRASADSAGFNPPISLIITGLGDISGDSAILRIDGVEEATDLTDQGTGNFLAYPIYFGARAGTSFFYNGYEDTSIVRFGPNLDDTTISKVESYVASKTPEPTL